MIPRAAAILLLLASCAPAQERPGPGCHELKKCVYKITLLDPQRPREKGPMGFGGGFFLSADGTFITARHLFEQSPHATRVVVEVNDGPWLDCPLETITATSRKLDVVIGRVRLDSARVNVPVIAPSARKGESVTGFTFFQGPFCTAGHITATSTAQIAIRGERFLAPGSSGSPVFNAAGRVAALALEMINRNPGSSHPDWIYTGLPIGKALQARKLAAPMAVAEFLAKLNAVE